MEKPLEFDSISEDIYFDMIGKMALLFHKVIPIENTVIVTDTKKFRHYFMGSEAVVNESDLIGSPIPAKGHIPIALSPKNNMAWPLNLQPYLFEAPPKGLSER